MELILVTVWSLARNNLFVYNDNPADHCPNFKSFKQIKPLIDLVKATSLSDDMKLLSFYCDIMKELKKFDLIYEQILLMINMLLDQNLKNAHNYKDSSLCHLLAYLGIVVTAIKEHSLIGVCFNFIKEKQLINMFEGIP